MTGRTGASSTAVTLTLWRLLVDLTWRHTSMTVERSASLRKRRIQTQPGMAPHKHDG